ncbi:hypothetical protein [Serinicoccus sediminis]|uniref:hypothetical protein n=1 Tax=Serinicoccus sediminis TaxID=2306021 RepID=UPI00102052E4|nr:hypothetical protein [Serinicoccus sediminis]
MSTWFGQLGSMVEVMCESRRSRRQEDRWLFAGGEGTLSPVEALMVTQHGAGARRWDLTKANHAIAESNALASLVRAQQLAGQGLRMVPHGAQHMNMLTPGASEEMVPPNGATSAEASRYWTGALTRAGLVAVVEPVYSTRLVQTGETVLTDDTVLDDSLILRGPRWTTEDVAADETTYASASVTLPPNQAAVSPVVPLLGQRQARFGVFLAHAGPGGSVTVTLQGVTATGTVVSSATRTTTPSAVMRRETWLWDGIPTSAVGARMVISHTADSLRLAWPSITLGDRLTRWVQGQCADQVVIFPPTQDPTLLTPGRSMASTSYQVMEVGV